MKKITLFFLLFAASPVFADLTIFPTLINFYNVSLDGFGQTQYVTIRNSGTRDAQLTISHGCFGDFTVTNLCTLQLSPGMSCNLDVRFAPRREGSQSCYISVSEWGGLSQSINVYGTGVRP